MILKKKRERERERQMIGGYIITEFLSQGLKRVIG